VIERILPFGVASAESRADLLDAALFPEEEATVARAVEKRRREFATGRECARRALAGLGIPAQSIPVGERGAPHWPRGVVGSITHCDGYRACAVARSADLATIGIDAEPNEPLPAGLIDDIAIAEERPALAALRESDPAVSWDRLLFCVKEAVYKAWFPLTRMWLGFEDAAVRIDRSRGTFGASLLIPGPTLGDRPLMGFTGRWLLDDGVLLAAIALAAQVRR
jgi:4'-phosphopantetheinyl transferase EntD